MRFIQTYKKQEHQRNSLSGISYILKGDYMGSAEFEFGSVQKSYRHITANTQMSIHKVNIPVTGVEGGHVCFYVLADMGGLNHFKQDISIHLAGRARTKEGTGIREKFVEKYHPEQRPDFWLSIDRYVYSSETSPVIAFSDDHELIQHFFLYLTAGKFLDEINGRELKIFDQVFYGKKKYKVAGVHEKDVVTLKFKTSKVTVPSSFAYPVSLASESYNSVLQSIYRRSLISPNLLEEKKPEKLESFSPPV